MVRRRQKSEPIVNPLGEMYTTEQAAQFLKVDPRTVLREISRGKLKAKKLGKGFRITRDALEAYWKRVPETQGKD